MELVDKEGKGSIIYFICENRDAQVFSEVIERINVQLSLHGIYNIWRCVQREIYLRL